MTMNSSSEGQRIGHSILSWKGVGDEECFTDFRIYEDYMVLAKANFTAK